MLKNLLFVFLAFIIVSAVAAQEKKAKAKAKSAFKTVDYPCSYDNSMQKALVWIVPGDEPRPLIVVLHTWSFNYKGGEGYALPAKHYKYHMIAPDFRGRNNAGNPLSMGSDAAVADIISAVEWMKTQAKVDENKIYLMGGSGGGHMALLVAGRHPEIWAGVSAWCPISDLNKWCEFHKGKSYGKHIISNLKADPRTDKAAAVEAARRSPVNWLKNAKNVNIDIGTGIHDGHTGAVPVDHSLNAFNVLADEKDKISDEDIACMVKNRKAPEGTAEVTDSGYGKRKIHYRKVSGNCRVTIFEGGHNILTTYSFKWLAQQEKGKPAVWKDFKDAGKAVQLTK